MDAESYENDDKKNDGLLEEIAYAQSIGISIAVDGKPYSVRDMDKLRCVMENHDYMKSYVSDGVGKIIHIDFDQIISV